MNFRKTNIIFISLVSIFLINNIFFSLSIYLYFLIIFLYFTIIFYASFSICSNFYLKIFCKSKNPTDKIAITFDDGPHEKITPKILEILEKYNAKATFFCIGNKAKMQADLIKTIHEKGHTIGNHTKSHKINFTFSSKKKVQKEINDTNKILEKIIRKPINFFRPPFGITNPNIAKAVYNFDIQVIGWSIRSLDTVKNAEQIKKRIRKTKAGDIILFHDTMYNTINILDDFLFFCQKKNLKCVKICDL